MAPNRTRATSQRCQQSSQVGWSGDHDAIISLQLFEQARLPQHLGIQAFCWNKEDCEFQRVRRPVWRHQPQSLPEMVVILAGKLRIDGQQHLVAISGKLDRVFNSLGTTRPNAGKILRCGDYCEVHTDKENRVSLSVFRIDIIS